MSERQQTQPLMKSASVTSESHVDSTEACHRELVQLREEVSKLHRERKRRQASARTIRNRLTRKRESLEEAYGEMEVAYVRAQRLATYDSITALPNRRLLDDRLSQALSLAKRQRTLLAVLVVDLDRFKKINDLLGHSTGDRLLRRVAERLVSCVRSSDTVARLSGDEFAIVLLDVLKPAVVGKVVEKINDALATPYVIEGKTLIVTASIGVATYPHDGEDAESLLHQADMAMYQVKRRGRNGYAFSTKKLTTEAKSRVELETELYDALEGGQFELHYQPKIDTKTNRIVSAEALIRWRHPERGLVPPADFIPLAEETNLAVGIGEWVLTTACTQNKAWQNAGYEPISVAVNVSTRQLETQHDLISIIERVLHITGLEARWLELELTEGVFLEDSDHASNVLQQLRQMGLSIAIDDFGMGYSSLGKLHQLPIDHIKIDRSFVHSISRNPGETFILEAIISLGHNLGLKMIAEGVEQEEQLQFLKERGCQQWQGFYCSKPAAAERIKEFLRAGVFDPAPGNCDVS